MSELPKMSAAGLRMSLDRLVATVRSGTARVLTTRKEATGPRESCLSPTSRSLSTPGARQLLELFGGRSQLIFYRFFYDEGVAGWPDAGCVGCSSWADGIGRLGLLHARDTTFATQLLYRLRDGSKNAGDALGWLESELESTGSDAEEIIIAEHQTLSSGNVTTGNIIRGLRHINDVNWTVWFESISRVDALLRERTNLSELDFASRDQYRRAIESLARRSRLTEYEVALPFGDPEVTLRE